MEFESDAQKKVYEKVGTWLKDMWGEQLMTRSDSPAYGIVVGSAFAQVWVTPWMDDDSTVRVMAWVVQGCEQAPELFSFLIKANSNMRFGAFAMDDVGDVCFIHTIVGSTCDKNELRASVLAVIHTADKYDDEIVGKWGGQRAIDKFRSS